MCPEGMTSNNEVLEALEVYDFGSKTIKHIKQEIKDYYVALQRG